MKNAIEIEVLCSKDTTTNTPAPTTATATGRTAHATESNVQDVMRAAFGALCSLASGPNLQNQIAIANSEVLTVVNRMLAYAEYTAIVDIDEAGAILSTTKGLINSQLSSLLLSLVEGVPDDEVVQRLIGAIEWSRVARHLQVLKKIMHRGVLVASGVHNIDGARKKRGKKHQHGRKHRSEPAADEISVPKYVCDMRTGTCAEWLSTEGFRWYTICETLRIAGTQLQTLASSTGGTKNSYVLEPMSVVFRDTETVNFYSNKIGQVEIIRENKLERLFFLLPSNYQRRKDAKMIRKTLTTVVDRCPREDPGEKLRAFVAGSIELAAMVDTKDEISKLYSPRLPEYYSWFTRNTPTLYLSMIVAVVCCGAWDKESSRQSLSADTFGRTGNPQAFWYLFLTVATIHFVLTVAAQYTFMVIRFPVLRQLYARASKMQSLAAANDTAATIGESTFVDQCVLIYGLPWRNNGRLVDHKFLTKSLKGFGIIAVTRVVHVEPTRGDGWESERDSWALVHFADATSVSSLIAAQEGNGGLVPTRGPAKKLQLHLKCFRLSQEQVKGSVTLGRLVEDAEQELRIMDSDPLFRTATRVQSVLNHLPLLRYVPVVTLYVFRNDKELRASIVDVAFSAVGLFHSPLFFSWHLFKLTATKHAAIVVSSMTHNIMRLSVTLVLCLLFAWVFAVSGQLWFETFHVNEDGFGDPLVANEGGPCANLLTCFMTYSYSALMQIGLGQWLKENKFPEAGQEMLSMETMKTIWEVAFSMIAMFVVSIITGIICDTFGELRGEMDEAIAYRTSTCFITGIPFAVCAEERSTNYETYAYLLLYLRRKRNQNADLSPLEAMVSEQIERGDIGWLPDGRCSSLEKKRDSRDEGLNHVMRQIEGLRTAVAEQGSHMVSMMEQMSTMQEAIVQISAAGSGLGAVK